MTNFQSFFDITPQLIQIENEVNHLLTSVGFETITIDDDDIFEQPIYEDSLEAAVSLYSSDETSQAVDSIIDVLDSTPRAGVQDHFDHAEECVSGISHSPGLGVPDHKPEEQKFDLPLSVQFAQSSQYQETTPLTINIPEATQFTNDESNTVVTSNDLEGMDNIEAAVFAFDDTDCESSSVETITAVSSDKVVQTSGQLCNTACDEPVHETESLQLSYSSGANNTGASICRDIGIGKCISKNLVNSSPSEVKMEGTDQGLRPISVNKKGVSGSIQEYIRLLQITV